MTRLIDTGSTVTVLKQSEFGKFQDVPEIFPPDQELVGFGHNKLDALGVIRIDIVVGGKELPNIEVFVVRDYFIPNSLLIGRNVLRNITWSIVNGHVVFSIPNTVDSGK